ncbi:MAG: FAD:protein FMN transferase [Planctomycetes bacterium]|nr:FAD:protein FMN transferase [Planctomycetota bacterium]
MHGLLALIGLLATTAPDGDIPPTGRLDRFEYVQRQMGVPFGISLYASSEADANAAAKAAFARVKQLNRLLSDYEPDSELMRLGRTSGPGKPVPVSDELFFMLRKSQELSRRSDGAFDVTVGTLVKLWRKARRTGKAPDPATLAEARSRVGWEFVRLDPEKQTVELLKPGMQLDLGGIAKGYAGDEVLRVLKEQGIERAMIDAGGDIVVGEPPPGKEGWRIGIAPLAADEEPSEYLILKNAAVATSGDAFQYVELEGIRYSHILDPKTGLGLTKRSSVTVIALDGATADSLASAISVLGPKRGLKLIEQYENAAALIVAESDEGRPVASASKRVDSYLERSK